MPPHRSPLIVEFVGLPGAGKTTVFHQLVAQGRAAGRSILPRDQWLQQWQRTPRWQRWPQLLPRSAYDWEVLTQALTLATQVKPLNRQSFAKAATLFANVKRLETIAQDPIAASPWDWVLLDQGVLQETWSVGLSGTPPTPAQLEPALASLLAGRPLAIVHVQVDLATALDRIYQRSTAQSRFDRLSRSQAEAWLTRSAPYLQTLVDCTQRFGIPLLEVDGSHSVTTTTQHIMNWLVQF